MSCVLNKSYKLIITIVTKGNAKTVVAASKKAGAEGGTTILGRGTGIREARKLLGICIDPEKEVVLTLIDSSLADTVLAAIVEAGKLNKPGHGIALVLNTKQISGIAHLLEAAQRRESYGQSAI